MGAEADAEKTLRRSLEGVEDMSIKRFLSGYGKVRTKAAYMSSLQMYRRWLSHQKGVVMSFDELIKDNLRNIYESTGSDVARKRIHTDWLAEYLNEYLPSRDLSDSRRNVAKSAVFEFYKRNDAALVGFFKMAPGPIAGREKSLASKDIREVLRAMPLPLRAPLLVEWQSSIEINRVLTLTREDLGQLEGSPHKISLVGRKKHRRPYFTFIGSDSFKAIQTLPKTNQYVFPGKLGPVVDYKYLEKVLKRTALRLMDAGVIGKYPLSAWRSHQLRASFKTEAEHAGVKSGMIEFFMGHDRGIEYVYDRGDELHEEDYLEAYKKIEPHVSLDYTETTLREEYEQNEKRLLSRVIDLEKKLDTLLAQPSETSLPPSARRDQTVG